MTITLIAINFFPTVLNLEPMENAYGTTRYNSGLLRVAFIRGNENLKTQSGEPIDGRKLSGGAVLVNREKYRDLWMKVRDQRNLRSHSHFLLLLLQSTFQGNHFGDDFHTYQLLWTNKSLILSVDDVTYGTIDGDFREVARMNNVTVSSQLYGGEYMAPFDKEVNFFLKKK